MKNFTQQEVQWLQEALDCLGKTKGIRYFGICGALANKLTMEFKNAQKEKDVVELGQSDLAASSDTAG